jgi:hypothetical protein
MRKPLYFDGAPDLFSRTKALFSETSRLQVRYPGAHTPQPAVRRGPNRHQIPAAHPEWLASVAATLRPFLRRLDSTASRIGSLLQTH